jgi:ribonucleotide monophosphatase NagD (HAD superfamily)
MIIAVDFDGTLHTGEWPEIGAPAPYAADTLQRLSAEGHYIIIWTCREGKSQTDMVNWLIEHEIPFNRINDNTEWEQYGYNARKVNADVYIDDRNVGGLPTWDEIYDIISKKSVLIV